MVVLQSVRQVPSLLREQPILFVPMLLLALVQTPQLVTQWLDPLVSTVLSLLFTAMYVFVFPFFHGGTLAMANDSARRERTSLRRFLEGGRRYYLSLLGAYLLVFGGVTVFGIFAVGSLLLGVFGYFATGGSLAVLAGVALLGLFLVLVYVVLSAAIQFYGHVIVIENVRAIDGLKRSVSVVRENLRQVAGYYALVILGGVVVGGGYALVILRLFPQPEPGETPAVPGLETVLAGLTASTLLLALFGTVFLLYSVVFYRAITVETVGSRPTTDTLH